MDGKGQGAEGGGPGAGRSHPTRRPGCSILNFNSSYPDSDKITKIHDVSSEVLKAIYSPMIFNARRVVAGSLKGTSRPFVKAELAKAGVDQNKFDQFFKSLA